jgi:hypothetical protein
MKIIFNKKWNSDKFYRVLGKRLILVLKFAYVYEQNSSDPDSSPPSDKTYTFFIDHFSYNKNTFKRIIIVLLPEN